MTAVPRDSPTPSLVRPLTPVPASGTKDSQPPPVCKPGRLRKFQQLVVASALFDAAAGSTYPKLHVTLSGEPGVSTDV